MLDKQSKEYIRLQLEFKIFELEATLLEFPLLLKTPIVRNGKKSTIGYEPEIWKKWIEDEKTN
jgi:arsenate reductase-like glutaredoxin family protein